MSNLNLESLRGKNVLILDDIWDSGATIQMIWDKLQEVELADLKVGVLIFKRLASYNATVRPDFVGVSIPNEFIAGYGMDYNEVFRNLGCVGIMSDFGKTKLAVDN